MQRPTSRSKQIADRLKILQALEIASTRLLGGWLPGVERWEMKYTVCEHLWQDAQHSKELRTRLWELRVSDPDRNLPDGVGQIVDSLSRAQVDYEFLAGLYLGLKPGMVSLYREIAGSTYEIYDAPTIPVVRRIVGELETQIAWAKQALPALSDSGEKGRRAARWLDYVKSTIACGGLLNGLGKADGPPEGGFREELPGYGMSPLPFAEAKRDDRFEISFAGMPMPEAGDLAANTVFQFVNYAQEMQAAETLGSLLWEATGMDWEFYYDIARHCYDEARHSKLGETRLKQLGHHVTDFPHCVSNYAWRQLVDPLRRYCVLTYVIEADSFKYKHATYQRYLEVQDMESAEAVLYDITDETLHVRWGKKWVPKLIETAGYDRGLDVLVEECRDLLKRHSVNPVQRRSAEGAVRA